MSDPLSIAVSLMALAGAARSTCKLLFSTAKIIVEARTRIADLAQSLSHFSSILKRLASVIKNAADIIGEDGLRDINYCRRECRAIVSGIEREFKGLDRKSLNFTDRIKWLFKQDSLRYPRARLERVKADLQLNIEVLLLAASIRFVSLLNTLLRLG